MSLLSSITCFGYGKIQPIGMGINVHSLAAQKADQRLIVLLCEFHGQAGRGGYGRHDWNACRQRLLHNFKRASTRDEQDVAIQRERALEKAMADYFIDGV